QAGSPSNSGPSQPSPSPSPPAPNTRWSSSPPYSAASSCSPCSATSTPSPGSTPSSSPNPGGPSSTSSATPYPSTTSPTASSSPSATSSSEDHSPIPSSFLGMGDLVGDWRVQFAVGVFRLGGCGLFLGFFASPAGQVSGMAFFRFAPFRRTWLFVYHAAGRAQGWFPCVPLGWFGAPCLQRDGVWPGRRDGASLTGRRLYWVTAGRPLVRYRFNREWFWGNFGYRRLGALAAGSG